MLIRVRIAIVDFDNSKKIATTTTTTTAPTTTIASIKPPTTLYSHWFVGWEYSLSPFRILNEQESPLFVICRGETLIYFSAIASILISTSNF